ncbi:MAG TPA: sulfite exporter TauE/SafE family protein [Fimbriimonas sp.]|nr:sulfite exporter TauE/SafE family protein [Fimbriimonas sp.]
MSVLAFTLIVLGAAFVAGLLGSLTGLGGGVIITPVLTLYLGVNIRYAMGASLISVIATSSGAAVAYVREGFSNVRIGMFLEVATTFGALVGAALSGHVPTSALSLIFGVVLLHAAWQATHRHAEAGPEVAPDPLAESFQLGGHLPGLKESLTYRAHRVKQGFAIMFGAGALSGLLGIGSGSLKVIAMDRAMQLPFKVSTATSNFMIGVTAAASAGIFLNRGYVEPGIVMPVMLGVLLGSMVGARFLARLPVNHLRIIFGVVVACVAVQMVLHGLGVKV